MRTIEEVRRLGEELNLPVVARLDEAGNEFRKNIRTHAENDFDHMFCDLQDALAICVEELIRMKYDSKE